MLKHKWLWGLIVVLLLAASPALLDRYKSESNAENYEVIIPYDEIEQIEEQSDLSLDEVFDKLEGAGLTTVSLVPVTLEDLAKKNTVLIYEENELAELLHFTNYRNDVDLDKVGYYITIPKDKYYKKLLKDTLKPELVTIADESFYFVSSEDSLYTLESPIGYDQTAMDIIESHGLNYAFRVVNDPSPVINRLIVDQLIDLKSDAVQGLLPSGEDIIGFGQAQGEVFLSDLMDAGYKFYYIESSKFKGYGTIGKVAKYDVIRLHSMDANKDTTLTINKSVDRTVRAVKERNIKSVFYHIKTTGNMTDNLNDTVSYLNGVNDIMPDKYTMDTPSSLEKVSVPSWAYALILLAGILFVYIASEILMINILRYLATAVMIVLAAAFFLLDRTIFIQAFALIVAVVAPTYGVIKAARGTTKFGGILLQYLKAVGITAVGIVIMVSLLNGTMFMSGFAVFRGVILVYMLPLAGVFIHVLVKVFDIDFKNKEKSFSKVVTILNFPIRYWHLIIVVVLLAVGLFYISRSGNGGTAPGFELTFRQWLEDIFYARPRTKEFLIGFPFFVLAIYVLKTNKIIGRILLIPGVIGFLSIMNTFSHLHISLGVSVLRTVYGVILGFIVGFIFIGIYKLIVKFSSRLAKRWS